MGICCKILCADCKKLIGGYAQPTPCPQKLDDQLMTLNLNRF